MIPKNVLSCWFGRGEKTDLFKRCRESKLLVLDGWNFIDVDEDHCGDLMSTPYMRSVHARGEFVKCTELARLWALFTYGGVYMDEDVEAVKPFDPLLDRPFFIGREDARWTNGAVIGSVGGGAAVTALLADFPRDTQGSQPANAYGPLYLTPRVAQLGVDVLPPEYFYPYRCGQTPAQAVITPNTYAMHHWAGSWVGKY